MALHPVFSIESGDRFGVGYGGDVVGKLHTGVRECLVALVVWIVVIYSISPSFGAVTGVRRQGEPHRPVVLRRPRLLAGWLRLLVHGRALEESRYEAWLLQDL